MRNMYVGSGEIAWEVTPGSRSAAGEAPLHGPPPPPPAPPGAPRAMPDVHASTALSEPPQAPAKFSPRGADGRAEFALDASSAAAAPAHGDHLHATPPPPLLPVITLHGVEIHAIDEATTIAHVLGEIDAGRGGFAVTPNLDHLRRYSDDVNFGALVAEADLVLPDGMPLVWAARLQGTPLPGRVAGSDLIWSLSAAAAARGRSIFMLGGAAGTAEGAARKLTERYPSLKIVGTHCP